MATSVSDLANLGRRVASQQGMSGLSEQQAAAYGREFEYRMGKGQNVPSVEEFFRTSKVSSPVVHHEASPSPHRTVRFLGFEVARAEAAPAPNRVQRGMRQATTGRGRRKTLVAEAARRSRDAKRQQRRSNGRFV